MTRDFLIKVPEKEFRALLDRETVLEHLKEHFVPRLQLIEDVVNYGTNLIPRCMASSERKLKDVVLLTILLRQVVGMLDGVQVLLSSGAVQAANLQLRALFEAAIYAEWMLAGDAEKKALYYYVHNLRRRRKWALLTEAGSPPHASDFEKTMSASGVQITDEMRAMAKRHTATIERALQGSRFASINKDFCDLKKLRRGEPPWYSPLGPKNLAELARSVGRESLYILVYSVASGLMHSSAYEEHVQFEPGRLKLQPIRQLQNFPHMLLFSVSIAFDLYRRVLSEYRPGELAAFRRKYFENWQRGTRIS